MRELCNNGDKHKRDLQQDEDELGSREEDELGSREEDELGSLEEDELGADRETRQTGRG
ncbi:hypothetical protein M8C21_025039, partial [Ambrosia artemisiifolia]